MDQLPVDVKKILLAYCAAPELLQLTCVSRELRNVALLDTYWKRLYWKAYGQRLESSDSFLGRGFFRAFYQEALSRRIRDKSERFSFNVAPPDGNNTSIQALYSSGSRHLTAVFADGRIVAYDLQSGEAVHSLDTRQRCSHLVEERDTKDLRTKLSSAHRNKLFSFKTREYEGSGFDIWSDAITSDPGVTGVSGNHGAWSDNLTVSPINSGFGSMKLTNQYIEKPAAKGFSDKLSSSPLTSRGIAIRKQKSGSREKLSAYSSDSDIDSASVSSVSSSLESRGSSLTSNASLDKKGKMKRSSYKSSKKKGKRKHGRRVSISERRFEIPYSEQTVQGAISGVVTHNDTLNSFTLSQSLAGGCVSSQQRLLTPPSWAKCSKRIHCVAVNAKNIVAMRSAAFATGHDDGVVLLWNGHSQFVHVIHSGHAHLTAMYLDTRRLVTADKKGFIQSWEPRTARRLRQIASPLVNPVTEVKVMRELLIASSENGKLAVWNMQSGKLFAKVDAHETPFCMHVMQPEIDSAEGKVSRCLRVATGGEDKLVKAWKFGFEEKGIELDTKVLGGHTDVVRKVHIDHQKIVSCSDDGTMKVWDIEGNSAKLLRTFKGTGREGRTAVVSLAVLPGLIIGGKTNGAIVGYSYNRSCVTISDGRRKTGSSTKKGNRSKYKQQKYVNYRTDEQCVSRDAYMDILYDDDFY